MLFIGLLIATATAEPKKVLYIDFEVIDLTGKSPQPAVFLVVDKPRPAFKPLSELYIVEPARTKRVACAPEEVPELGIQLDKS